jgi:hypothetical protein
MKTSGVAKPEKFSRRRQLFDTWNFKVFTMSLWKILEAKDKSTY